MNHYSLALALSYPAHKAIPPPKKTGLLFERSSQAQGQYQGGFIERDRPNPSKQA